MTKIASKIKLVKINETEVVNTSGVTKQTKYYNMDGRKFAIAYENSNGSPMGFNSKMCLRQYDGVNAKWHNLEDIKVLGMGKIPNYFSDGESRRHMNEFFTKMEKHLTTVYC